MNATSPTATAAVVDSHPVAATATTAAIVHAAPVVASAPNATVLHAPPNPATAEAKSDSIGVPGLDRPHAMLERGELARASALAKTLMKARTLMEAPALAEPKVKAPARTHPNPDLMAAPARTFASSFFNSREPRR